MSDFTKIDGSTARHCYLDIDLDGSRAKLATTAAFVNSTNIRYGLSSDDLLKLGGSEISRLSSLIEDDHEWSTKINEVGGYMASPPETGCRVVVELDWDHCPLACENFATLCANGSSASNIGSTTNNNKPRPVPIGESGKPLTYRGCTFHRCIPGFCLQGGDFVKGNGSGGECVFANKTKFKDEKFGLQQKHDRFGTLSMGNSGKNSNSSQFFFTLNDNTPASKKSLSSCDGKHVVFGRVISGGQVLRAAEKYGSIDGTVSKPIIISDCGVYQPFWCAGQGFWYDKPSPEAFSGISPTFVVKPRVALLVPRAMALAKFEDNAKSEFVVELAVCLDEDEGNEGQSTVIDKIVDALFGEFSVDVVIAAPACQKFIESDDIRLKLIDGLNRSEVKKHMKGCDHIFSIDQFVLVAKPTDLVGMVREKSWLYNHNR
jgi:cyclophilin family peptidyl-prolyl cis-trans isomerase